MLKVDLMRNEFEEVSVPVRIPEEIEHGLYGTYDFNIITGFKFRGDDVEEYEGEVEDRDYDVQLTFFAIKDGETHNLQQLQRRRRLARPRNITKNSR